MTDTQANESEPQVRSSDLVRFFARLVVGVEAVLPWIFLGMCVAIFLTVFVTMGWLIIQCVRAQPLACAATVVVGAAAALILSLIEKLYKKLCTWARRVAGKKSNR